MRKKPIYFDEIVPSDIPKIHGVDRVIHGPVKRPWNMHPGQDYNLLVLQGTRYIDIFCPKTIKKASFIVTPDKIYKNDKFYFNGPAMVVCPAGIFHRIISGGEGSISVNFATQTKKFDLKDNFNI